MRIALSPSRSAPVSRRRQAAWRRPTFGPCPPAVRPLRTPFLTRLLAFVVVASSSVAFAQSDDAVRIELGIGGHAVANAWNPIRLSVRDRPDAVLTIRVDQGTLRSGEIPIVVERSVRGGAGVSVFEDDLYLPTFRTLTWSLTTADRVLGSGSMGAREQDERPLDLLLSADPGRYRAEFGETARLVDVAAADLPLRAAAFDGVRSLVIDGSVAAPRLEAVAAAASGGAVVVLHGTLPASHRDLLLLVDDGASRLGAGRVVRTAGTAADVARTIGGSRVPERETLLAAVMTEPLVELATPLSQQTVLAVTFLFALAVVALVRWVGAPGLVAAIAVSALLSLAGWRVPDAPQLTGAERLGFAGGPLALVTEAREVYTLPAATIHFTPNARPLTTRAYRVDDQGAHFSVERWRSVLVALPPFLEDAPLRYEAGVLRNAGNVVLHDVHVVGLGPQGDLAPGASRTAVVTEEAPLAPVLAQLLPHLGQGTAVARSHCDTVCTTWIVSPIDGGDGRRSL
jgi:hypothetical protein